MTDLSTDNLKRLLAEATPGPWEARRDYSETYHLFDAEDEYLGIMHDQDAHLTALAPDLAQEVIRLRREMDSMRIHVQYLRMKPDQTLGDHDD